jgi:hypothetical protein
MRILGLAGLVVALAIVALLVGKQLGGPSSVPARADAGAEATQVPSGSPRQIEDQFKQSLDAAMQSPRPMPDEAR